MESTHVDQRPGLDERRLARLVRAAVDRCHLSLAGVSVLTEAATGPYVVTPVIAALAGADVTAVTRSTSYGSADEVRAVTMSLAGLLDVEDRITITDTRSPELFGRADLITNSAHLRPIDAAYAAAVRSDAVVSLMFEAWEIQAGRVDVDLAGLLARGVAVAGTNERHPDVDVFGYLGPMAVAQLADAGISAYRGTIAVLCDNAFADFLSAGLRAAGATVTCSADLAELLTVPGVDALVVALRPTGESVLSTPDLHSVAAQWPDVLIAQFWGDVDRSLCDASHLACWPRSAPPAGHMGVLPSRVGPEPVVRLQAAGLKVGQVLLSAEHDRSADDLAYLDLLT